jgi:hypothetical protein
MAVDFEGATAALATRLESLGAFRHVTRILEDWDSSAPAQQPALMLTSGPIGVVAPSGNLAGQLPPLWTMELLAVLYVQVPDPTVAPSTLLNPLIAAVCNALLKTAGEPAVAQARFLANPPGQFSTTLGGLCAACYVTGTIDRFEGLVGRVAVAHIPIAMVLSS